jgi:hypothetical protein
MGNEAELVARAQSVLGPEHPVLAAGIFGLQDNYAAIAVGGLASSAVAAELPGGAMTDGIVGAAGVHATREVVAQSKGVTVRMLVAVTDDSIHLFALSATGSEPGREVMTFSRATTRAEISKFGASRHLKLTDSAAGQEIGLTGSAAFFSSYAEADKAVLAALSGG